MMPKLKTKCDAVDGVVKRRREKDGEGRVSKRVLSIVFAE